MQLYALLNEYGAQAAEYGELNLMRREIVDHDQKTSQAAKMLRDMRSVWEQYRKTATARTDVESILQNIKLNNSTTLAGWSQEYLKTLREWCQSEMEALIKKIETPDTRKDVDAAKDKGLKAEGADLENAIAELYRIRNETANDADVIAAAAAAIPELESRKTALHAQGAAGGLAGNAPPGGKTGWDKFMEVSGKVGSGLIDVSDKVGGGLDKAAGMYVKMEETRLNAA